MRVCSSGSANKSTHTVAWHVHVCVRSFLSCAGSYFLVHPSMWPCSLSNRPRPHQVLGGVGPIAGVASGDASDEDVGSEDVSSDALDSEPEGLATVEEGVTLVAGLLATTPHLKAPGAIKVRGTSTLHPPAHANVCALGVV